jgi:hypothetical protein
MKPNEWLLEITATKDGYQRLLEDAGSLAVAAWRLAVAKCQTQDVSTHVPSGREVRAAARQILDRAGVTEPLPTTATLAFDCERVGLLVI